MTDFLQLAHDRYSCRAFSDRPVEDEKIDAPDEAWVRKYHDRNLADVDASIVGTHIMLVAADLGLGTTWMGRFDAPAVKEAFPQTAGYDLVALFPLEYPAEGEAGGPSPRHAERRAADELVSRL